MKKSVMKKLLLIILVVTTVFVTCTPVSLCAPEGFQMLTLDSKGTDVIRVQMRLRDLGYFNYRATGMYYGMTQKAVMEFQQNNELDPDGRVGEMTYDKLFSQQVVRKPLSATIRISSGPSLVGSPSAYGELADWYEVIASAFSVGKTVTITDFNSGVSFDMKRTGGVNHADVEPVDADAYDKYIECFGGEPNWEKRAVLVAINGTTYAASLFGNQMGEDTISGNTMDGHTCLYFYGSCSDVYKFTDKENDKMVLVAAGEPLQY